MANAQNLFFIEIGKYTMEVVQIVPNATYIPHIGRRHSKFGKQKYIESAKPEITQGLYIWQSGH